MSPEQTALVARLGIGLVCAAIAFDTAVEWRAARKRRNRAALGDKPRYTDGRGNSLDHLVEEEP